MNSQLVQQPAQVAFIFNNVAHYQELAAAFRPDVEVHILDATQDGLAQMAAILEGRSGIEALHVVGHGAQGALDMGSLTLDNANIGAHADVLGKIGSSLASGGDILLYGCDVGANAAGAQFVGQIAQVTGADVAASTDLTGGAQLGGDWTLEYRAGVVTADGAFDTAAVRNLDTLLVPTTEDVSSSMTTGAGNFITGFTLSTAQTVKPDTTTGGNGSIWFDTTNKSESFTVTANGSSVATFDLTGVTILKPYSTTPEYTITITGHKADGSTPSPTAVLFFHDHAGGFTVTDDFSDMTGLVSFDVVMAQTGVQVQGATPGELDFDAFVIDNVALPAPSTPDLTDSSDLGSSISDNLTNASSIAFSGIGPTGDSTSTVRVFIDKNNNGAYDAGTDVSGTATLSNGAWTVSNLSTTGLTDGTYKAYALLTGTNGVSSALSPALSFTVDHTAPTLTISSDKAALLKGQTATITFSFSEDPGAAFTSGDISVSGGTLGAITGTGTTRTATFTPTANTDSSTATIAVAASAYSDAAGNALVAASKNLSFDTKAPTVTITSDKPALHAGQTANITFTFSEDPGATFSWNGTSGDIAVSGGTLSAISGTGTTRTAVFTPTAGNNSGTANITIAAGSYTDGAGNSGGAGTTPSITFDTLAPTVTITSDKPALKVGETAAITFTFSEDPGSSFTWDGTSGDLAISGGTLSAIAGSGTTRTATFTPAANTNNGTASITIAANSYTDAAGNNGGAGTTPSLSFDTRAPTVAVTSDKTVMASGDTATITFTFSEDPGSSFSWDDVHQTGDLTVSGGTLGALSGTGTVRTATFTAGAGATASIAVTANSYADLAGNAGAGATSPTISLDTTPPDAPSTPVLSAGMDSGTSSTDNLIKSAVPTLTGTAEAGSTVKLYDGATQVGSGTADGSGNWSIVTSTLGEGAHSITAKATDAAGNTGLASGALALTIDTTKPTLTIASDAAALTIGQTATITFTFSEDPGSTFTDDDVVVSGGTLGAISGTGTTRTAVFTPTANTDSATASITVDAGKYTDAAGNDGLAGATPILAYDTHAPSVTITSDKPALKIGETAVITFTFSENPGASFDSGDVVVSSGTLSAISGTGLTRTATFTPTANSNNGSASITVGDGLYTDAAGNPGHAGTTPSLVFDTLAPGAPSAPVLDSGSDSGTSNTDNLTNVGTPKLVGTAEAGATVKLYDGATLVGTGTADVGGNWWIVTNTLAEGAHAITATATDAAGNTGASSGALSVTVDQTAPTLVITSDKSALLAGQAATITFTFSEDPGGTFTSGDIAVSGGTLGALSGTGTSRTAVFTPDADTNSGTASITVAAGKYTDAAGNDGIAGATPSVHFDTLVPTVTITSDKPALKVGETALITFTFSEDPGASFGAGDVVVSGGTLSAISGTGQTRTATFTPTAGTDGGTASITIGDGLYTDAAGNPGHAGTTPSLAFDTLAPAAPSTPVLDTGSDSGTSHSDNLTNVDTPQLSGTAEAGATVRLYDGATLVGTGTADIGGSWSIVTGTLAEGAHAITATATDAAGNTGAASGAISVTIDQTAPTLAITSDNAALLAGQAATITFTFSEDPGSTFASGDIAVGGGTLGALSGSGTTRTAVFTPDADTNAGTASITVGASTYTDAAGNDGGAGITPTLHFDTLVPTVAVTSDKAALKAGETALITFTFSEDPGTSFSASDLTVSGGTLAAISGTGTTRTAVFTPTANINGGTAGISIGEGSYLDAAGNAGHAGATPSLTFDTLAPTLAITSDKAALIAGQTATITFTFSEDPGSSFAWDGTAGDIVVSGGTLSALSGTGSVRTAVFTPTANTNGGTASIAVANGSYTDAAGNDGGAGTTPSVHFDTLVPTVTITSDKPALKIGETANITFTFSEDPGSTFNWNGTSGSVTVSGGTLGAISGTGTVRTAVFTPAASTNGGTASITIDAGQYADAAGNSGLAGATPGLAFDTLAPGTPPKPVLATDSGISSSDNITNAAVLTFTGSAEDGASVTLLDNSTSAVLGTATATGGTWSIPVDHLPEGAVSVAAFATDAAANVSATSSALDVTIDRTAPAAPSLALASGAASGSTVRDGNVKVLNLDTGATWQYSLDGGAHWQDGSGDSFTPASDNSYVAIVRQLDTAGNVSAASAELRFTLDTAPPTSTVAISDASLSAGETGIVTITFSEPVTGFDLADIHASNVTLSNLASSDGGRTWTALMTPVPATAANTNVVSVDNTGVQDVAGNAGAGSGSSPNYSVLTLAKTVSSTIQLSDTSLTAGETAVVTIRFSEAVRGFSVSNISVENGKLSGLSSSDGGQTWTATLTPAAHITDATNVITLDNTRLTSASGLHGEGVTTSANYSISTIRPTASLSVTDHLLAPNASTSVKIKFSEAVAGFDSSDLSVTHATVSKLATNDGGVTWTATLTADAGGKSAEPSTISLDMSGVHDLAGSTGQGALTEHFVVVPANAAIGTVDGAQVVTQTVTDPGGTAQRLVIVPEVMSNRVDDAATPHPGMADIPLATTPAGNGAVPILTASLPVGTGLEASGSPTPLAIGGALTDLVGRILDTASQGSGSQAELTAGAQDFLSGLGSGTLVLPQTLVPTVSPNAQAGQPITITGAAPGSAGTGAPLVGLVIDASALPAGTTLQLDNVDFAAVVGDVRLIGGAGRNYVIGDGASQVIYLGADDDVLNGGGGNDFIGSAGGDDRLNGGDGNDLVAGGIGNDTVSGDAGDDMVTGGRSTVGDWDFHVAANGTIAATHAHAVFTASGTETVQGAELDASVPELRFLKADPQKVAGIALLYAALDRVPDMAGLSFWSTSGASLQDVAKGVLASAEFGGSALGQTDNKAFITGMYQHVLGRAPEQAALDYWTARLAGTDGKAAASRTDVLIAVALSDEHKAHASTADGISVGQTSVQRETAWFTGSGDDILDGGPGNDLLVGGDGVDTAVYSGNRAQYHFLIGADNAIHVLDTANGDIDTLSGIEAAKFKDGTSDISFLNGDPAQLGRVGLMFEAVLQRPADLAGLKWWTSLNLGATQLAQAFTTTAEYQSHYAGMGDAAFVQALYANSGLAAGAAGGEQSWQDYLAHHSRAELIAAWIGQDDVVHAQFGTNGLWLV
ncbi:MAG: Ig-like domain-containing protein [Telluria sp.]